MGCGAIGGVLTASLAETGQDVTASTTNDGIHAAVHPRGLKVVGEGSPRLVRTPVIHGLPPEGAEKFDYIILATQPPQVEEAARSVAPFLADDGALVCLQNGLCEERLGKIVGPHRVIGGVVGWGATMPEPGLYERTAPGGFTLGQTSDEPLDPRHDRLVRALEAVGPVEVTQNLRGKRWSKLAINCAISTLGTIGGDRLGTLMQHRFVRRLGLEIMTEVVDVARKEGVRLEKVSGTLDLAWIALTEEERLASGSPGLVAKHGLLLAVGFRYRRMKSSMLSAIERGRTPAVDFLNGEVVDRARKHGIKVPVNTLARDTVWEISKGKKRAGLDLLREVYEATAPHGN
ncbi:2-dehydropantoate 2-reductase [Labilithrix luteola]|uniref:2-dehydropantoate 2-reductase n=1 Tax=Labilithrix luteola TaxID=1391654 RepID=A0A0K1PLC4_9BACT|nr:ketopantoate reductase family protein [Labilithrix luteola]AKU94317.1 2-dehydropantoate 2-reductase [Labilithrix luteola]